MTVPIKNWLNRLTASELATIDYESGLTVTNTLASPSFDTYMGQWVGIPDHTIAGGANVTFSFDPGAGFTDAQKASIAQSVAIWSGMANVNFTYQANPTGATLLFLKAGQTYNGSVLGSGTFETSSGGTILASGIYQLSHATIQVDLGGGYGDIASYSTYGGYGIDTLVHEVGHFMGLGHSGPYNGTVTPSTDQYNATDVRTWSIMSYINPTDLSAKYYSSYTVTGTNWGITSDYYPRAPYTPMALDIFAAQRLDGAPTSLMFAGGQVFGFHSNIMYTALDGSQQKLAMYDFTVDTNPVVTLYDYGSNNTLDLSGFSTTSTINLNDGMYSSAAGMTNNIFIEFGTQINSVIGGSGNDSFTVNGLADTVDGGGGTNTVIFPNPVSAYTISYNAGTASYSITAGAVVDTLTNIQLAQFGAAAPVALSALACFLRGTRIAAANGEVAVETLRPGDLVRTASGQLRPILWVGYGRSLITPANRCDVAPVVFRPGALGQAADGSPLPRRDLAVTRRHAMLVGDVLVPAELLVNDVSVLWDDWRQQIEFYHIELATHDLLLAEGAPSESFRDDDSGQVFHNGASRPHRPRQPPCRPVVEGGLWLDSAWRRIAALAGATAQHTADPDLHLRINGIRVDGQRDGDRWIFDLASGAHSLTLVSRSIIPASTPSGATQADRRRLGVAVREIIVWRGDDHRLIDLADRALTDGWHPAERGYRWTKGQAVLNDRMEAWLAGPVRLEVRLMPALHYRVPAEQRCVA